jgi:hypothetical protein
MSMIRGGTNSWLPVGFETGPTDIVLGKNPDAKRIKDKHLLFCCAGGWASLAGLSHQSSRETAFAASLIEAIKLAVAFSKTP